MYTCVTSYVYRVFYMLTHSGNVQPYELVPAPIPRTGCISHLVKISVPVLIEVHECFVKHFLHFCRKCRLLLHSHAYSQDMFTFIRQTSQHGRLRKCAMIPASGQAEITKTTTTMGDGLSLCF